MQFFLPKTHQEARWFLALSVTAGICEEVLYRGFLIRYLGREPGRLGMIGGVLVALLAFGAAHLYQGVQGFLNSAIGGLLFAVVFLLTGNLVLPILFHIAADALLVPVVKE
jgi:membrane protease YdiL (CAAX protease family)